jgi:hypothetical protein
MDATIIIYYDNINEILFIDNPIYHVRTKHIKVHYHFMKEKFSKKD